MAYIQSKNSINIVKIIFDENKDEHRNQHGYKPTQISSKGENAALFK